MATRTASLLALTLLAWPAAAAPPDPATRVADRLERLSGEAYRRARADLASLPPADRSALRRAANDAARDWRARARAGIHALWADQPQRAAAAQALPGLSPRRYLAQRRPEPAVEAELLRLGPELEPLLFEILLVDGALPPAPAGDYPAGVDRGRLAALERSAARLGAVGVLARSPNPDATSALAALLDDPAEPESLRAFTAARLGARADPDRTALLARLLEDEAAGSALRAAALAGLGEQRTRAAQDAILASRASVRADSTLRRAAWAALGASAGAWATARLPAEERALLGRRAAEALWSGLLAAEDDGEATIVIEALSRLGPSALPHAPAAAGGPTHARILRGRRRLGG